MMQEPNPRRLKATILEVVDNQLREHTPPESKKTYDRLLNEGYSDQEARQLIGAVLSSEIYEMLKHKKEYNQKRYIKLLNGLPELPWE